MARITIPKSVKSIGFNVFEHCESLEEIYYEGSLEQWSKIEIDKGNDGLTNAKIYYDKKIKSK